MIRFKISGERFAEACNIAEYIGALTGDPGTIVKIAPRFVTDKDDNYIVSMIFDEDGDIESFEGLDVAGKDVLKINPKRLEKLIKEFKEAARLIVNPTNGGDSKEPMSTEQEPPPPG